MKLQDQCCTREQGQRLVELGITVEATFWHMPAKSGPHGEYIRYGWHGNNLAPAFNVAELGELLPKGDRYLSAWKTVSSNITVTPWEAGYHYSPAWFEFFPTEAQARAALLIHLLENKLITWVTGKIVPTGFGYSPELKEPEKRIQCSRCEKDYVILSIDGDVLCDDCHMKEVEETIDAMIEKVPKDSVVGKCNHDMLQYGICDLCGELIN